MLRRNRDDSISAGLSVMFARLHICMKITSLTLFAVLLRSNLSHTSHLTHHAEARMPRLPRLHTSGAIYYVTVRGNYRQDLFI
jgi:hypothetical protein